MPAIAHRHEGASKRMPIDFSADLDQAVGFKELDGAGPDDIGPATCTRAFFQLGGERFAQHQAHVSEIDKRMRSIEEKKRALENQSVASA